MSEVGHRGHNAPAEAFFSMLKWERIRRRYLTIADAPSGVFDYIVRV